MGIKISVDKILAGPDKKLCDTSLSNKFGCLVQGVGKERLPESYVKGTTTIFFAHKSQVPTDAKRKYANLICDIKSLKSENAELA